MSTHRGTEQDGPSRQPASAGPSAMGLEPGLGGKSGAGQAGLQRSWKGDRCEPGRAGDRDVAKGEVALWEEFGLVGYLLKSWVGRLSHDDRMDSIVMMHQGLVSMDSTNRLWFNHSMAQPWHGPAMAWPNHNMARP
jgi:hypothetical protein